MIVKERNFNNNLRKDFKNLIISDLFDKIGIALSAKRNEVTEELVDEMAKRVDNYFYTLVASDTPLSCILPDKVKDARRFYIFAELDAYLLWYLLGCIAGFVAYSYSWYESVV